MSEAAGERRPVARPDLLGNDSAAHPEMRVPLQQSPLRLVSVLRVRAACALSLGFPLSAVRIPVAGRRSLEDGVDEAGRLGVGGVEIGRYVYCSRLNSV